MLYRIIIAIRSIKANRMTRSGSRRAKRLPVGQRIGDERSDRVGGNANGVDEAARRFRDARW